MLVLCLGLTAFILYFLYDINSILWRRTVPRSFFLLGTVCLTVAVLWDVVSCARLHSFSGVSDILLLSLSLIFLLLLIYALFFALPFDETYTKQSDGRHTYKEGVYALCRHPGILFFFLTVLPLGLAALPETGLLIRGMIFSLLNLLYAWFQDRKTFPQTFCDYQLYRQETPFLIPTRASIRLACKTIRK